MASEEALARKKNIHAAHRSSATRLMGLVETLMEATPTNADELTLLSLLEILGKTCQATHMIDSSMVCMILAQTSMKSACAMHGSCFTFWHATSMTHASPLA